MPRDASSLPDPDRRRLARWRDHLAARGAAVPEAADFLTHGRLSTLERLHPALAETDPGACGPLREALQELRRRKRARAGSKATGGRRGPALAASVEPDRLPAPWRTTLDRLGRERARVDAGGIVLDGPRPPARASLGDMAWVLRAVAKSSLDRGWEPELRRRAVAAWLADAEGRGCRERGLTLQMGLLRRFALHHDRKGLKKLARTLGALRLDYARRGERRQKRKEAWVLKHPTTLGAVWARAEKLLARGLGERAGSRARHKLVREAAALALAVVVPLRIGDLHRFRVGREITRDATGWAVHIRTSKTRGDYEREALWPELTPFLDAVIEVDAPGGELWVGYDVRVGTPLLTTDFGRTALSGDWISDVWEEHVGCGAHIVRTLWHQLAWESDRDLAWVALALCGQRDERSARHYRVEGARRRAARSGRGLLRAARAEALRTAAGG